MDVLDRLLAAPMRCRSEYPVRTRGQRLGVPVGVLPRDLVGLLRFRYRSDVYDISKNP